MDCLLTSTALSFVTVSYFPDVSVRNSYIWTFSAIASLLLTAKIIYSVILYPVFFTPYKHLPSPPVSKWLLHSHDYLSYRSLPQANILPNKGRSLWNGYFKELTSLPQGVPYRNWCRDVPNNGLIRTYVTLNFERLFPTSPKAWADVLVHRAYDWEKSRWLFLLLEKFTGVGLLLAEGDVHKVRWLLFLYIFSLSILNEINPLFF